MKKKKKTRKKVEATDAPRISRKEANFAAAYLIGLFQPEDRALARELVKKYRFSPFCAFYALYETCRSKFETRETGLVLSDRFAFTIDGALPSDLLTERDRRYLESIGWLKNKL